MPIVGEVEPSGSKVPGLTDVDVVIQHGRVVAGLWYAIAPGEEVECGRPCRPGQVVVSVVQVVEPDDQLMGLSKQFERALQGDVHAALHLMRFDLQQVQRGIACGLIKGGDTGTGAVERRQ
ncbi:hypothetical protein D3C80_672230 [compost metagenome]